MKKNRIIWFCLWVLSIVGISLKGGTVTYGFFTVLTLVPLTSALYLLAVFMFFHIYQELEQRFVSVNEPVRYRFSLVNEVPLQFVSIRVRFFSSFSAITDLDDETEYELNPYTRIEKETRLICKYRGEYEIGIKEIEIQDFFRLFKVKYRNKECIHAVVKPQLVRTDSLGEIALSDAVRESQLNRSELDILSREYVSGDDPRFLNWTQSARTGSLMTRILTGANHQEVAILTDTLRTGQTQAEFLPAENKILETALAISYYLCRNNIYAAEYHLQQALVRLTADNTRNIDEFYQMLSEVKFSSLYSHRLLYEALMRSPDFFQCSMVFLILSVWDAETDAILKQLAQNHLHTVICLISEKNTEIPDISSHKSCNLVRISPHQDLAKELGK